MRLPSMPDLEDLGISKKQSSVLMNALVKYDAMCRAIDAAYRVDVVNPHNGIHK
jgi:hypothetical protein